MDVAHSIWLWRLCDHGVWWIYSIVIVSLVKLEWIWLSVYVWLWNCGAMVEHHTNGELWWRVRWLRSLSGRLSSWWIVPPDWWCGGLWLWQTTIAPSSAIFHGSPLFSPGPTIGWSHSQETDSEENCSAQNCHPAFTTYRSHYYCGATQLEHLGPNISPQQRSHSGSFTVISDLASGSHKALGPGWALMHIHCKRMIRAIKNLLGKHGKPWEIGT